MHFCSRECRIFVKKSQIFQKIIQKSPQFLKFCFRIVNFSCKNWKSRESLKKTEFFPLKNVDFLSKIANLSMFECKNRSKIAKIPKFCFRNVNFSSQKLKIKGISPKLLNFVQKWLNLQGKKLKFPPNLSKVSGKKSKNSVENWKNFKKSSNFAGKKVKVCAKIIKSVRKKSKNQTFFQKNLNFQEKTEKISKISYFWLKNEFLFQKSLKNGSFESKNFKKTVKNRPILQEKS